MIFLCGDEPLAAAVCNLQKLHKDVKTNISWFCIVEQLYSPLSGHNTQRAFTSVDLETKLIKLWRGLFSLSWEIHSEIPTPSCHTRIIQCIMYQKRVCPLLLCFKVSVHPHCHLIWIVCVFFIEIRYCSQWPVFFRTWPVPVHCCCGERKHHVPIKFSLHINRDKFL